MKNQPPIAHKETTRKFLLGTGKYQIEMDVRLETKNVFLWSKGKSPKDQFIFQPSQPETLSQIGRLFIAAAELANKTLRANGQPILINKNKS